MDYPACAATDMEEAVMFGWCVTRVGDAPMKTRRAANKDDRAAADIDTDDQPRRV
jgi:hypothetical protein